VSVQDDFNPHQFDPLEHEREAARDGALDGPAPEEWSPADAITADEVRLAREAFMRLPAEVRRARLEEQRAEVARALAVERESIARHRRLKGARA
jgi:hypothetical protein